MGWGGCNEPECEAFLELRSSLAPAREQESSSSPDGANCCDGGQQLLM